MRFDRVWRNARLATLAQGSDGLGVIEAGAIAASGGRIAYVGPETDLPRATIDDGVDCEGRWITPGLIDCHTHLVYAGSRAEEFESRLNGTSYADIAAAGGGILSTVRATRAASEASLLAASLPRLDALLAEGVTTVEIKSGYGLELEAEARQLRVAQSLGQHRQLLVITTFLAAHALPPEAAGDKDRYIASVIRDMLPRIAQWRLAEAVDAFCEGIAFSAVQIGQLFDAARRLGFKVKLHADQLSNTGGAALAAASGALSADHLEYADANGVAAMARAGTVAVLLPGAFYTLREPQAPPVAAFRAAGVKMALATDCNPGTAPLTSLLLTMNMGATLFGMTVAECLAGVTREAARALGRQTQIGTIEVGKSCDLAIWDIGAPAELVYRIGFNPLYRRVWRGV